MHQNLESLEKALGIIFHNKSFLYEAVTHRSYLNENPRWEYPHNERLEFLGDAVLELAVTERLFHRYPNSPEGHLTSIRAALVNYQMMAEVARALRIEDYLLLSRGEAKDVGRAREVILANAMEAVIGAVYLDQGYEPTQRLILRCVVEPHLEIIIENSLYKDPKSHLQEVVQERFRVTPRYQLAEEWGPDHKKIFRMAVYFGDDVVAEGEGYSKQEAEVEAAKNALKKVAGSE
ncbi:ribonuclease III [Candidatus Wolfebacteria bacterium]|nr:ribonuclease III [Candidatus Wolfebacteria bacterium]